MTLKERITRASEATAWEGEIPVHYLYTYGIAGEKFFRGIMEKGTFLATQCKECGITYLPPRIYCERCFKELTDYVDVGLKGEVYSYTVCHHDLSGKRMDVPRVVAHVRIQGTDGGIIHYLDVLPQDARIGMKVEAVLNGKKKGGIHDIKCFRPI